MVQGFTDGGPSHVEQAGQFHFRGETVAGLPLPVADKFLEFFKNHVAPVFPLEWDDVQEQTPPPCQYGLGWSKHDTFRSEMSVVRQR